MEFWGFGVLESMIYHFITPIIHHSTNPLLHHSTIPLLRLAELFRQKRA